MRARRKRSGKAKEDLLQIGVRRAAWAASSAKVPKPNRRPASSSSRRSQMRSASFN
jgi:hypothetical protein